MSAMIFDTNLVLAITVGLSGLLIGSFLNVVVYRVPAGKSIVSPPSACPGCDSAIRPYDNIPVISWLVLRGKCRDCRTPISLRYPLVELATALFFFAVAARFVPSIVSATSTPFAIASTLEAVAFLYVAGISAVLTLIDLDTHTLPNRIVLPSYIVLGVLLSASSVLSGDYGALLGAAIGGAVLFGAYLLLALAYSGGMGFGDVKLAGVLGLALGYLGWGPLVVGAFSAFLLGGLFALVLLIARRVNRKGGIPFGPWMLAGAWIGIFAGESIWRLYLSSMGLT
jgi:leader peptidase (prepilin peptidase) / N-methyltransferase